MLKKIYKKSRSKDEAEKPFWISYADLMTAGMALFLVVMAVTIISLKKKYSEKSLAERNRERSISACFDELKKRTSEFSDLKEKQFNLEPKSNESLISNKGKSINSISSKNIFYNKGESIRIDLGQIVKFKNNDWRLSLKQSDFIREYMPKVIDWVTTKECSKFFRRVMVEGYTSKTGNYIYNLGLSQKRSKQIVCALFDKNIENKFLVSNFHKNKIKDLFLVGGYSFNDQKKSDKESRRVELKLEFWKLKEKQVKRKNNLQQTTLSDKKLGVCS